MLTKLQNHQQLNSEKHKFRQRMIPISNSFVSFDKVHSLRVFAPLGFTKVLTGVTGNSGRACFSILALLFANFTICNVASALSISVPQTISFDIVSGKANHSEAATIEILSDDALAGYTLTLSGSDTLDASVSANGSLGATAKDTSDENEFDSNTWGLKYCNLSDNSDCIASTNYKATSSTEALQIDKTAVNNSQPVKYALSIGAKTSDSINADTYSSTFTLAATPNPVYHSVGFVDWTENMPDAIAGTGESITLPTTVPTKPGYTFAGWCKVKPTSNGTTCTDPVTLNATTGKYDLTTVDGVAYTNLYATWEKDIFCDTHLCLQTVEFWKGVIPNDGDTIIAYDQRDGKAYEVGRIKKGDYDQIWMLDNLALETTTNDLSPSDTNVPNTWTGFPDGSRKLPASSDSEFMNPTTAMINSSKKNSYSSLYNKDAMVDNESTDDWKYGVYYNYCAAVAGEATFCKVTDNTTGTQGVTQASQDICPKGWKLPSGNTSADSDLMKLYIALGGTDTSLDGAVFLNKFRKTLRLPLAGYFYNASASHYGETGYLWSATYYDANSMYRMLFGVWDTFELSKSYRHNGFSIRCVAK